jgi:hypothetical protein
MRLLFPHHRFASSQHQFQKNLRKIARRGDFLGALVNEFCLTGVHFELGVFRPTVSN